MSFTYIFSRLTDQTVSLFSVVFIGNIDEKTRKKLHHHAADNLLSSLVVY